MPAPVTDEIRNVLFQRALMTRELREINTLLDDPSIQHLLAQSVSESSLVSDGNLTHPRSWGVYEVQPTAGNRATRKYRLGNHPVRQQELEKEFGAAKRVALFTSRGIAEELKRQLNARP
jgi:hypothetical protein